MEKVDNFLFPQRKQWITVLFTEWISKVKMVDSLANNSLSIFLFKNDALSWGFVNYVRVILFKRTYVRTRSCLMGIFFSKA